MLNQAVLVGRMVKDPELRKVKDNRSVTTIRLAIKRPFKSARTDEYETDFLDMTLWSGIAEATVNYCKKGDIVGVKARLQQKDYHIDDERGFSYPEIIVEKISFISHAKD